MKKKSASVWFLVRWMMHWCAGRGKGKARKSKERSGIKRNAAHSYTYRELASATQNFREANIIGKGGFGCVYKGHLDSGQASYPSFSLSFTVIDFEQIFMFSFLILSSSFFELFGSFDSFELKFKQTFHDYMLLTC